MDRPCWLYFDLEYAKQTNAGLDILAAPPRGPRTSEQKGKKCSELLTEEASLHLLPNAAVTHKRCHHPRDTHRRQEQSGDNVLVAPAVAARPPPPLLGAKAQDASPCLIAHSQPAGKALRARPPACESVRVRPRQRGTIPSIWPNDPAR